MAQIDVMEVAPKKGDVPFSPFLHIYLSEYSSDSKGRPLLSPQLMTDKEIDESIDYLLTQLEKVRKSAKTKLKKTKERTK